MNFWKSKTEIAQRIAWALSVAFSLWWLNGNQVWLKYFNTPNRVVYLTSNILRIFLMLALSFFIYKSGEFIRNKFTITNDGMESQENSILSKPNQLDNGLFNFLLGIAATGIFAFILCNFNFLSREVVSVCFVLAALLWVPSFKNLGILGKNVPVELQSLFRRPFQLQSNTKSIVLPLPKVLLGICVFYFYFRAFIDQGLYPHHANNDAIGHYLPYFQHLIDSAGFIRSHYFVHNFFSKGMGVVHLLIAVTDVQSIQIANWIYFSFALLILFRISEILFHFDNPIWKAATLISLLILGSDQAFLDFQKLHVSVTTFILCFIYFGLLGLNSTKDKMDRSLSKSKNFIGIVLSGFMAAFVSPVTLIYLIPFSLINCIAGFWNQQYRKKCLLVLASLFVSGGFSLFYNYLYTGMWEYSPRIFFRWSNFEKISQWIDPRAIEFQYFLNPDDALPMSEILRWNYQKIIDIFSWRSIESLSIQNHFLKFLAVLGCFFFFWFVAKIMKGIFQKREQIQITPMVLALSYFMFTVLLLGWTMGSSAFYRFTAFFGFFKLVIYLGLVFLAVRLLSQLIVTKQQSIWEKASWISGVIIFGSIVYFAQMHFYRYFQPEKFDFLIGKRTYREVYETLFDGNLTECLEISDQVQGLVGSVEPILSLKFHPQCFGVPIIKFPRSVMAEFSRDFAQIFYKSEEQAILAYKKHRINFFYIDLSGPFTPQIFSPLFHYDRINKRFKVLWRKGDVLLLTWKDSSQEASEEKWKLGSGVQRRNQNQNVQESRITNEELQLFKKTYEAEVRSGTFSSLTVKAIEKMNRDGFLLYKLSQ